MKKLIKLKASGTQGRMDSFFKPIPKDPAAAAAANKKRKEADTKAKKAAPAAKKGKGGGKPRK